MGILEIILILFLGDFMQIESQILNIINAKLRNPIYQILQLINIRTILKTNIPDYFQKMPIIRDFKGYCFSGYFVFPEY